MAEQYHIGGPLTITYGGVVIGRTDGVALPSITLIEPSVPILDDSAGGMAVDEIQRDTQALVALILQSADLAVINALRGRLKDSDSLALEGEAQRPGFLRRADSTTQSRALVIEGTKLTDENGLSQITFLDAIMDAESDLVIQDLGPRAAKFALGIRCYSKLDTGTWKIYTKADVTGT